MTPAQIEEARALLQTRKHRLNDIATLDRVLDTTSNGWTVTINPVGFTHYAEIDLDQDDKIVASTLSAVLTNRLAEVEAQLKELGVTL